MSEILHSVYSKRCLETTQWLKCRKTVGPHLDHCSMHRVVHRFQRRHYVYVNMRLLEWSATAAVTAVR